MVCRKLLDRGDDDLRLPLDRRFQLPRGSVDLADDAGRLLELCDSVLKLSVEYDAIRHHDRAVENRLVGRIVQRD